MKYILLLAMFLVIPFSNPDKAAYTLFDKKGGQTDYEALIKAAAEADVVLFGEYHDNPICHWLQMEMSKDLFAAKGDQLMIGAEMFEADNQLLINEYMIDHISQKSFEQEARTWPNYKTDYKPIMEFSKENYLGFVATNIPRRYASMVFHKGLGSLDGLSDEAKKYIAPLPIAIDFELPAYKSLVEMGGENFAQAQAVKDATMGHFITENLADKRTFLHLNGSFHSDDFEGISWYINKYAPGKKILTIATVSQDDISKLDKENVGKADFTLNIPDSMTKTH